MKRSCTCCQRRGSVTPGHGTPVAARPELAAAGPARVTLTHPFVGPMELLAADGPDGAPPATLCCENETNVARLFGTEATTPFPKDGINDHVVHNAATVNPAGRGTKCAFWYKLTLASGASAQLRVRLRPRGRGARPVRSRVRGRHRAAAG